jgi:hypothetical protein
MGKILALFLLLTSCPDTPAKQHYYLTFQKTQSMTTEQRNQLVSFEANPEAPASPEIGIALAIGKNTSAVIPLGKVIILNGSFSADGALLLASENNLAASIHLSLARLDKPSVDTARLITPTVVFKSPNDTNPPVYSKSYRERGQFKVDLSQFFQIPAEAGKYAIQATLGTYKSESISFEITP